MKLFAPFNSDGYKLGHASMYADGTEVVYSNLTPRSDRIYKRSATKYYDGKLVLVGCQGALMEIVENWDKFFSMDKGIAIARFKLLCDNYLGKDVVSVDGLSALHDLGFLPLEIKTLDEGSKVPMGVPVLTIRNTVPHAFWLVNFLETTISNLTWKPATAATIAAEYKAMLLDFAESTGSPKDLVLWQAHDFSARGLSGPEDAARIGMGHLSSFLGTDSLGSILYAQEYYGGGDFVAGSVPATEHAVATSNILRIERLLFESGDAELYKFHGLQHEGIFTRMLNAEEDRRLIAEVMFLYELMKKFPTGILSYVTDSFDFWAMLTKGLPYLKEVIMARDGKLVIRPDSGDPVKVVCGFNVVDVEPEVLFSNPDLAEFNELGYDYIRSNGVYYKIEILGYDSWYGCDTFRAVEVEISEAEVKGATQVLWELFGGVVTDKGYGLLDEHIGLIYGDSITTQRCLEILEGLEKKGLASGNCVFGVGSFTYQCNTRDTFGFAVKATYTEVNGKGIPIFKDPKTDSKKKSAKGLLQVVRDCDRHDGEFLLIDNVSKEAEQFDNLLICRFKDGEFFNLTTIDEIRSKL